MARAWAAGIAGLAILAGASCGGEQERSSSASAAKPVGQESAGSVAQFADCGDWKKGTKVERVATVDVLRGQLTPQRSPTAESPLADERAYELLDRACAPGFSDSLRLYKLYVRMQGFAPLSE